jgi:hypothetical protein
MRFEHLAGIFTQDNLWLEFLKHIKSRKLLLRSLSSIYLAEIYYITDIHYEVNGTA